jgi:hypothetical protein
MEGENVANCSGSENDNKTDCISFDDVSNCSEQEPVTCLEKAPVIITLDPHKKLSKICEKIEEEPHKTPEEQEIKIDDEKDNKNVLETITPAELERLKKIFGPGFTMENEISKPESALGVFPSSHIKDPNDSDLLKQKFKNI